MSDTASRPASTPWLGTPRPSTATMPPYASGPRIRRGPTSCGRHARAAQLELTVAWLSIVLSPDPPAGTEVRVDDVAIDPASVGMPRPLDPGHHTLRATAPGRPPFETSVTLSAGGRVSITVDFQPAAAAPSGPSSAPSSAPTASDSAPATTAPDRARSAPVGAWVAVAVGAGLAAGAVVSFVLRASNLATLARDCTTTASGSFLCPTDSMGEVNGAHDAAKIEGPLGIGMTTAAVVALGIGAWLFVSEPAKGSNALVVTPAWTREGGGLIVRGVF